MKKIFLLLTVILLFTACNQKAEPISQLEEIDTEYTNEEFKISFAHPAFWEITENETTKSVNISSPDYALVVTIPSESFEEFKKLHEEKISEETMSEDPETYQDSILETNYPTKFYTEHEGINQIIKINDKYIKITMAQFPTEKEKEQLNTILESLSF